MRNCKTSVGTTAQKSSKCSLLFRQAALAAILLLAAVFVGCGGVSIEQEVKETSCLKRESKVVTDVVIKNWDGSYKTIEYQTWLYVQTERADSVKHAEYIKALPFLEAARNCR